jgi:hypothetical protein
MKSYVFSILSAALLVARVVAQSTLTVNTPSVLFFQHLYESFQLHPQNECAFLHTSSGYLDWWNWCVSLVRFLKIDNLRVLCSTLHSRTYDSHYFVSKLLKFCRLKICRGKLTFYHGVVACILILHLLSVHDGTNVNGAALVTFTNLTGTEYTWQAVTFAPSS